MDMVRRLIAWERRMGPPANRALLRFWLWAFVLIGPFGTAFGVFALVQGFWWQGCGLAVLGLGFTWAGWTHLLGFARSHLRREH
jgi:hypothetical protein